MTSINKTKLESISIIEIKFANQDFTIVDYKPYQETNLVLLNPVNGAQHCTLKCTSTGDTLTRILRPARLLPKKSSQHFRYRRNPRPRSHKLHRVNHLHIHTSINQCLAARSPNPLQQIRTQPLELLPLDKPSHIRLLHQALNVDGRLGVRTQDLLQLLASSPKPNASPQVRVDIHIVLFLELFGEMLKQNLVEVPPTQTPIECMS